ncbi:MAG: adenylosuccinate lyase [Anaplasma sp.]
MIERYSLPKMTAIWEEENRYKIWLQIEVHACEAQVELGVVPGHVLDSLKTVSGQLDIQRIREIEAEVKHDVIAFLSYITESSNADVRYLHYGMTSSDVLDTCFSLQLKESCDILLGDIEAVMCALKERSEETKYLMCVGRRHGVHAEPITFGLKLARFYAEFERNYRRLVNAQKEISVCKISGAMGNFAHLDPRVEAHVAQALGLVPEVIASQVVPRDRYAMLFATFGIIASSIERLATELRHLQQTEVLEVSEPFSTGQKGSSAMPHKKNPILSENLTGLARVVRSHVVPAMENVALWHERDISHSSVERFIAPDACITLDFALVRLANVLKGMRIHEDNIDGNLKSSRGILLSQRVLLMLVDSGMSRENAYRIVQDSAMNALDNNGDFIANVKMHPLLEGISPEDLDSLLSLDYYTKHVDFIFNKVFSGG